MAALDLSFRVVGDSLPRDHRYALFSAISRHLGRTLHDATGVGVWPVRGVPGAERTLLLDRHSRLRLRTPSDLIINMLQLCGCALDIDGHRIQIGVAAALPIVPASRLSAGLVTIKGFREPAPFLEAVQRQLNELGVSGVPAIPLRTSGQHVGEPARGVLRIKDKLVVGFRLIVEGLSAEDSLLIQEHGIGGRRHMGCGLFLPLQEGGEASDGRAAAC